PACGWSPTSRRTPRRRTPWTASTSSRRARSPDGGGARTCEDPGVAGRMRRGEEPLAVRAARERERHLAGVAAFGFFLPRRPRRSVTVTPAPLRYWQFDAARWVVVVLVVVAAAVWLVVIGARDGASAGTRELPLVVVLAVLVVLGSTGRLTVSDTALSTDIAGLRRPSSFGVVPL